LNISPDKVLVHFAENADTNTVKTAIAKNTSFQVAGISKADSKENSNLTTFPNFFFLITNII
jgi:hypothetical protein